MKRYLLIPLLLITAFLHAQEIDFSDHCSPSGNTAYPPAVRLKHYPFNKAAEIRLVSFEGNFSMTDSGTFKITDPDPGLLDASPPAADTIKESIRLTPQQIDKLTHILFNYGYGPRRTIVHTVVGCFDPRNAILFYDKEDKPLAFIAICYECQKASVSEEKIKIGDPCRDKLELLKKFFKEVGIKYGVE